MKRIGILLFAAVLLLTTACRSRTTIMTPPQPVTSEDTENEQASPTPSAVPMIVQESPQPTIEPVTSEDTESEQTSPTPSAVPMIVQESPQPTIEPVTAEDTENEQTSPTPSAVPMIVQESPSPTIEPVTTKEPEPDEAVSTEEDPTSEYKEYSDNADAEVTSDAETPVLAPTSEPADELVVPSLDIEADAEKIGNIETDQAEKTVTETVPADEAENLGTSEDAPVADTVLMYYQTLLYDKLGSLFECQKLYVYWETESELTTIFKTSAEHQLILDVGAYDVSARLLEENLLVNAKWIRNKNPGMIVKVTAQDILGSGVQSTASAQAVMDTLLTREGINGTDAAKNKRVLLLSSELLTTQARRTAAAIYIVKEMYPDMFADVDPDEALRLLTEEAGGSAANGIFAYAE